VEFRPQNFVPLQHFTERGPEIFLIDSPCPAHSARHILSRLPWMELVQHPEALLRNGKRAFCRQRLSALFHFLRGHSMSTKTFMMVILQS